MPIEARQALRTGTAAILRKVVFPGRYGVVTLVERILEENPGPFVVSLRGGESPWWMAYPLWHSRQLFS
jgi:hypothetical protein